jgi:hypothetical protein
MRDPYSGTISAAKSRDSSPPVGAELVDAVRDRAGVSGSEIVQRKGFQYGQ